MTFLPRLHWLWLTLTVVLLDRATKAWFESQTAEGWHHELIHNFVYLVHSRNPGIAFGIMSDSASTGTRIALILGSIAIIAVLAWLLVTSQGGSVMAAAGLALLLGGATGNVTDRILQGAVTDFFEEVRHRALQDAIGNIAGGAAEQESETRGSHHAAPLACDQQPSEHGDYGDGAQNQSDTCTGGRGIRHDAKGDPGIAAVHQINEIVDELMVPAFGGLGFEPRFGGAIEESESESEPEPAAA